MPTITIDPAIQADISLRGGVADGHLAALIAVARRRALDDVELEVTTTNPSSRMDVCANNGAGSNATRR